MRGSSYIPLPKYLADKKALINLKNDDEQCFKWAVTRAINPTESHPERIDKKLRAKVDTPQLGRYYISNPTLRN